MLVGPSIPFSVRYEQALGGDEQELTSCSCLYYWGVVGLLIGLTLYRPAYSAVALQGTLLDNSLWIGFWSVFALVRAIFPHPGCIALNK